MRRLCALRILWMFLTTHEALTAATSLLEF
jgi:hypothetical protein